MRNAERFEPQRFAEGIRASVATAMAAKHRRATAGGRAPAPLTLEEQLPDGRRPGGAVGRPGRAGLLHGRLPGRAARVGRRARVAARRRRARRRAAAALGRTSWLALGGLLGLGLWTLLSTVWAPIAGPAWDAGQRTLLYGGVLVAATGLLRGRRAVRWVEPAVAAGALVVVGYGLAERLLPGLLHYARSATAQGRLEQPLTYWNAMGAVAAMGVVACARLAGDGTRDGRLRAAAAAAAAPLGLGLSLTVSRGALFACAAGLPP